ncbi:MAG: methylmalonyl Co-A mutase-associated GTPase MeaB [Dehalococcoidia bacterium]|nr:methylmalonyl Co-A mutase-associated GTPase MeaB [Dehalococcoidia bacterium]
MDSQAEGIRRGDRRALSRFLSRIESGDPTCEAALAALYPSTGHAQIAGITGPPGAGKSTLVAALTTELRQRGGTVAVLAIDPSSPLTGGALLGDRVRMQGVAQDPGVFVRSAGSRGATGGLSAFTLDAILALDAFGFDHILLETVGAGQGEVDVRHAVHSVVLVQPPGAGDAIQALKAGLLEIADIYVVNKADQPGAGLTAAELNTLLTLAPAEAWPPPVLLTTATAGDGMGPLADALSQHQAFLREAGRAQAWRRQQAAFHIRSVLQRRVLADLQRRLNSGSLLAQLAEDVCNGSTDPYAAAESVSIYHNAIEVH